VRLSHRQWENTVRDLLRRDPQARAFASGLEPDSGAARFDTNAALLTVRPQLWLDYQRAAEALAIEATRTPESRARLLPPDLPADPAARARAFIEHFGLRAFRRPLAPDEVARYAALFARGPALVGGGDAFADGMRLTVEAMLQSAHFLHRTELAAGVVGGKIPLADHEVAAKLSYALAGTMPDEPLLAAAAERQLRTREAVRAQAERLLGTPAGAAALVDFHRQAFHADDFAIIAGKDTTRFPFWRPELRQDAERELELFVRDVIVAQGGGLRELLTASHTFVNARLAPAYGVPAPAAGGDGFARVALDPARRAGLLTQFGFLARFASATERDSIHRGVFVREQVLCLPLPQPPNSVPAPPARQASQTNRQRIEAFTGKGTCGEGCHSLLINPAGFAFESYDAGGRFQTTDAGQPIDASGSYVLDGAERPFRNAVELGGHIAASRDAHRCHARGLVEYLLGRSADGPADEPLVEAVAARSLSARTPSRALAVELVTTDGFLARAP
jgi:hypothetical protein